MARHNPFKIPFIDPRYTLVERFPVPATRSIPNCSLLPNRTTRRTLHRSKDLGQDPRTCVYTGFAELLRRGQVEHHICSDEGFGRAVVENEFFVEMRRDVFPVKFGVELGRDGGYGFRLLEEESEGDFLVALLFALFGERFDAHDLGRGIGLVPWAEEDVVLWHGSADRCAGYMRARTSASSAAMYFTSPSPETLDLTSSVNATGEKTARAPDCRRTAIHVSKSW
jgi:hypothetical protein